MEIYNSSVSKTGQVRRSWKNSFFFFFFFWLLVKRGFLHLEQTCWVTPRSAETWTWYFPQAAGVIQPVGKTGGNSLSLGRAANGNWSLLLPPYFHLSHFECSDAASAINTGDVQVTEELCLVTRLQFVVLGWQQPLKSVTFDCTVDAVS